MFNSITDAQDGFYRHHNAKPSVRRSVLFYQFLFLVFVLGGWRNPGGGENTQQPIFGLQHLSLLIFVLGGQQSRQRRKHAKANIWAVVLDNYLFSLALHPPVGTCQPVCCGYTPIVTLNHALYCQKTCRTHTSGVFHPIC